MSNLSLYPFKGDLNPEIKTEETVTRTILFTKKSAGSKKVQVLRVVAPANASQEMIMELAKKSLNSSASVKSFKAVTKSQFQAMQKQVTDTAPVLQPALQSMPDPLMSVGKQAIYITVSTKTQICVNFFTFAIT